MSRRVEQVSFVEFQILLRLAQHEHRHKNEPIPSLTQDSTAKIDSCLNAPFQTLFGRAAFVGFFKKATALFYYIAKGHPLGNGNKRMACVTLAYMCHINQRELSISDAMLVDIAHYTADSLPESKDECMRRIERVLRQCVKPDPYQ